LEILRTTDGTELFVYSK